MMMQGQGQAQPEPQPEAESPNYQDLVILSQQIKTSTTIEDFEAKMDKYQQLSNGLTEYILQTIFGEEYFYSYILPYFIDYSFIPPKDLLINFAIELPFYQHRHIKSLTSSNSYFYNFPIDVLMRLGPQKPKGFIGFWNGLAHLRGNGVECVIDQLKSFFALYNYSIYYVISDDHVSWYLKKELS